VLKKYKYATTASFMVRLPEDNRQKIIVYHKSRQTDKPRFRDVLGDNRPYPGTEYENIDYYDMNLW